VATAPNVFALFGAINRKSALIALSNAVRAVEYKEGLTMGQIGGEIDVDGETVENAKYQRNLLNFVAIARLLARWPEHCADVLNLWEMQPREPETPTEKRKRLIRELAALEDGE
jgi:hypothetical protein